MSRAHFNMPHRLNNDVPDEFEPGAPPVEPDEGPVPTFIPDGPEHDPDIDPDAQRARQSKHARRKVWAAVSGWELRS